MSMVKPLAQTGDTVTLKRADFDALIRSVEDAADLAAIDAHRAYEDRVGWDTARRNYLVPEEARRILDGESPVRVWREKRGIKQRTLAEAAEVSASYLAEIEAGKKPGSSGALQRIANVLEMPLEHLLGVGTASPGLRPVSHADVAAKRIIALVERGAAADRVAKEVTATIDTWRGLAGNGGRRHQVKAAIETLYHRLAETRAAARTAAAAMPRDGELGRTQQKQNVTRAFGAALDALGAARDALVDDTRN